MQGTVIRSFAGNKLNRQDRRNGLCCRSNLRSQRLGLALKTAYLLQRTFRKDRKFFWLAGKQLTPECA